MSEQSKHYESIGGGLEQVGNDREALRAYRAAQGHLRISEDTFLKDWNRLQNKIITVRKEDD